ncbi:hypothetical protein H4217_004018 [Coemansia sp. RSA 1939]|nr:hypothetical protein H4217_004018 [Coemansia sp. RSA 1939]KAJ2610656.1 hypothetical protein EV177_003864 [Coemansia sp. RSA 1804]
MVDNKTEDSGGNRRFSLFSALNGLFERARSSAEKESQRLFTSPATPNRSRTGSTQGPVPGDPAYGSPYKRPKRIGSNGTRPLLADSLARTKARPRPARSATTASTAPQAATVADAAAAAKKTALSRPSVTLSLPQRPGSVISERTKLATTVDLMSIVARSEHSVADDDAAAAASEYGEDADSIGAVLEEPSALSTPGSHLKRKRSVAAYQQPAEPSSPISAAPSTAATHSTRGERAVHETRFSKRPRSVESTNTAASSAMALDAMVLHTSALASGSTQSTATVHSMAPQRAEDASREKQNNNQQQQQQQQQKHVSETVQRWKSSSRKAVGFDDDAYGNDDVVITSSSNNNRGNKDEGDRPPTTVVERTRLEKVERELRQLKRIIASLVPGELNDDDLRSVYGELDGGRQSSEDVLSRLMRIRAGAVFPATAASRRGDAADLLGYSSLMASKPPSSLSPPDALRPTIASSSAANAVSRSAVPPPPPPLPPPVPLAALAKDSRAPASSAAAAARAQLSLPPAPSFGGSSVRKRAPSGSPDMPHNAAESTASRQHESPAQRLRADLLRPVAAAKPSNPPPPHKDPNVMSQMLQEMKTHKLRSVKKPKDMAAAMPKRQRLGGGGGDSHHQS